MSKAKELRYTVKMDHSSETGVEVLTSIEIVEIETADGWGYATRQEALNAVNAWIGEDAHKLVAHIEKARAALGVLLKMKVE